METTRYGPNSRGAGSAQAAAQTPSGPGSPALGPFDRWSNPSQAQKFFAESWHRYGHRSSEDQPRIGRSITQKIDTASIIVLGQTRVTATRFRSLEKVCGSCWGRNTGCSNSSFAMVGGPP